MAGPPGLPTGAQFAVLTGDPSKAGVFTIRARLPAGFVVPPYWHPSDEHITVLDSKMAFGMGSSVNRSKAMFIKEGGFAVAAARMNHYVFTNGGATIQVTAQAPSKSPTSIRRTTRGRRKASSRFKDKEMTAAAILASYLTRSTCSNSSSTGVARPKIDTDTFTRLRSKSSSSTTPLKLANGPSSTLTASPIS